jgi:AraC family transcriptional activator of pobA
MEHMKRFETVSDYNAFNNNETLHPLVSVVDLTRAQLALSQSQPAA